MKLIVLLLLITLLVSAVCLPTAHVYSAIETDLSNEDFFFGVTFGGNTTSEAKLLIDKVKGYTNLFVIDSWDICARPNETDLNEICEYAANANMNFMVYFSFIFWNYTRQYSTYNSSSWDDFGVSPWHVSWLNAARERWGDKFLGVYLYDEPGGKQIDLGYWGGNRMTFSGRNITSYYAEGVANYTDAANRFVSGISRSGSWRHVTNTSIPNSVNSRMPLFTSDYALYWFDYLAGYDAVFAEFGWDHSQKEHIALCRGAANVQEKDWGVIITWASNDPPYLASGIEMLQEMNTAYYSGAKYLIVFNYPQINPYGALTEEHFTAMETFWNQIHGSPGNVLERVGGQVALVLPKDYGWGMRAGHDNIWGFWPVDDLAPMIGEKIADLLNVYGLRLDIIYDDPQFNYAEEYSKLFFWNSTDFLSTVSCETSSSSITLGDSITVSGLVSPVVLANVNIQISMDNGTSLKTLTTMTSVSDGEYSLDWTPESVGSYELKALWEGDGSHAESTSNSLLVTVSKILTTLSHSISSSSINEGDSVTVSGVIDPTVSGKTVTLTYKKPDGSALNRTVTTDSDGSFHDSYRPEVGGHWTVFASVNGDSNYVGASSSEKSFELILNSNSENLFLSVMPIVGDVAAAIAIIAVVGWLVMRFRRQPPWTAVSEVKAHLIGRGGGTLEFIDNTIRFRAEKGRFRRQQKLLREIPLADIESMNRTGNDVIFITWKGITDVFVIEETKLDGKIFENIPEISNDQRGKLAYKEAAKQTQRKLTKILGFSMEIVNSLFDIIRSLQGWIDWNNVEGFLKRSEENARRVRDQQMGILELDLTKLSLAIKERLPEEIAKETNSVLRLLYANFSDLASKNAYFKQIHPNYHDAKTIIRACYLLNDIILATIVGDKKVGRERNELLMILNSLSKEINSEIDVAAIELAIVELGRNNDNEGNVEEIRGVFKWQLKKLISE